MVAVLVTGWSAAGQGSFEAVVSGARIPVDYQGNCDGFNDYLPRVQWFNPDSLQTAGSTGDEVVYLASPDHERIFATLNRQGVVIVQIAPDGTRTPFFSGLGWPYFAVNLAATSAGRLFVLIREANTHPNVVGSVAVISPAGELEARHSLPELSRSAAFAVANDGCTILYAKSTTIGRFDACSGTPLADLGTAPQYLEDIDALPDGRFLVLGRDLLLYDAAGQFVHTVFRANAGDVRIAAVAISPDGSRIYAALAGSCDARPAWLLEFSIAEGRLLSRRRLAVDEVSGLVVGNAPSSGEPVAVPATTALASGGLVVALVIAAVYVLRS